MTTLDNQLVQSSNYMEEAVEIQRGSDLASATHCVSPLHFPQSGLLSAKVITGAGGKPNRNNT